MNSSIDTQRLRLIALSPTQLQMAAENIEALEETLTIRMTRSWITERVRRAISIKLEKMKLADPARHPWFTYWLIVIQEGQVGAGMLGFKGFPDGTGSTEIGYGIDPAYQGKGYMSEAVQALIDWAFTHPFCRVITAPDVENPASSRLLERLGAAQVSSTEYSTSWEIRKERGI